MKIDLRYFTGTGNSLKILDTCMGVFVRFNHETTISEINPEGPCPGEADLLGFCFPVYAFGIPRICRKYLKSMHRFKNRRNPTGSIKIEEKKPVWSPTCEQCMRCINFCPNESIYQSMGGETRGKNKYHEPDFKPEHNSKQVQIK